MLIPKTRAGWPCFSVADIPAAQPHAGPNSDFEYQSPPSRKLDAAATTTAQGLKFTDRISATILESCDAGDWSPSPFYRPGSIGGARGAAGSVEPPSGARTS